jgi:hypothetical protein
MVERSQNLEDGQRHITKLKMRRGVSEYHKRKEMYPIEKRNTSRRDDHLAITTASKKGLGIPLCMIHYAQEADDIDSLTVAQKVDIVIPHPKSDADALHHV